MADCFAVAEAVEVAVTVTVPAAPGAVNMVAAPLAVWVGLKLPQEPVGVQVQSTPALVLSLVTVAESDAVPFGAKEVGAPVNDKVTAAAALIVTVAEAMTLALAVAVALIVTVPAAVGAV
jgi:hypothetical protein